MKISQDLTYGHSSAKPSFHVLRTLASACSCAKPILPYSADHLVSLSEHCTESDKQWPCGDRMAVTLSAVDPADHWLAGDYARCPAPRERLRPHIDTSPRKDPSSKSQGGFLRNAYRFHTIVKSKTCKSSHCESRTVCYYFPRSRKEVSAGSRASVSVDPVPGRRGGALSILLCFRSYKGKDIKNGEVKTVL